MRDSPVLAPSPLFQPETMASITPGRVAAEITSKPPATPSAVLGELYTRYKSQSRGRKYADAALTKSGSELLAMVLQDLLGEAASSIGGDLAKRRLEFFLKYYEPHFTVLRSAISELRSAQRIQDNVERARKELTQLEADGREILSLVPSEVPPAPRPPSGYSPDFARTWYEYNASIWGLGAFLLSWASCADNVATYTESQLAAIEEAQARVAEDPKANVFRRLAASAQANSLLVRRALSGEIDDLRSTRASVRALGLKYAQAINPDAQG